MSEHIICTVCLEELSGGVNEMEESEHVVRMTSCGHLFHLSCCEKAHKHKIEIGQSERIASCPMCRTEQPIGVAGDLPMFQRVFFSTMSSDTFVPEQEVIPSSGSSAAAIARAKRRDLLARRLPPSPLDVKAASIFHTASEASELGRDVESLTKSFIDTWTADTRYLDLVDSGEDATLTGATLRGKLDEVLAATQRWKAEAAMAQRIEALLSVIFKASAYALSVQNHITLHNQRCRQMEDITAELDLARAERHNVLAINELLRSDVQKVKQAAEEARVRHESVAARLRETEAVLELATEQKVELEQKLMKTLVEKSGLQASLKHSITVIQQQNALEEGLLRCRVNLAADYSQKYKQLTAREGKVSDMQAKVSALSANLATSLGLPSLDSPAPPPQPIFTPSSTKPAVSPVSLALASLSPRAINKPVMAVAGKMPKASIRNLRAKYSARASHRSRLSESVKSTTTHATKLWRIASAAGRHFVFAPEDIQRNPIDILASAPSKTAGPSSGAGWIAQLTGIFTTSASDAHLGTDVPRPSS